MPEPTPPIQRTNRALLIWAVSATVAAFVFGNAALLLFVKLRSGNVQPGRMASLVRPIRGAASPFATLQDSDVVGRYHLFQEGTNVGVITLLPNHSIINKDGTTFPQYHWEVRPSGLMTKWQRGGLFFDVMVRPGVYVIKSKDGSEYRRIEKLED